MNAPPEVWLEIQTPTSALHEVYAAADASCCRSIHHFQEPWFGGGSVVRVLTAVNPGLREDLQEEFDGRWIFWDAAPDERLYGDHWPQVRAFFEAASRLKLQHEGWYDRKLIHCALNSWGYDERDELRFFLRMAWGRLRIIAHAQTWRLLRRRGHCKYGCHNQAWSRP